MSPTRIKKKKRLKKFVKPIKPQELELDFKPILGSGVQVVTDPLVSEVHRQLGGKSEDLPLAKRVVANQQKFPQATVPELVAYDWLKANNHQFRFQLQAFGGRSVAGGLVPDFLVQHGAGALVWLVQGEYWHSSLQQQERDRYAIEAMQGMVIDGVEVNDVVQLWEDDIYEQRPKVFEWAMQGIGLRG